MNADPGFEPPREDRGGNRPAPPRAAQAQKTVEDRMSDLEKRVNLQERAITELCLRSNPKLSQADLDKVVAYMKDEFEQLEYMVAVHYEVLRDGTWHVVTIHNMADSADALTPICAKCIKVQNEFRDVFIVPIILHQDEVSRERLVGTKPVFIRAYAPKTD